MSNSETTIPIEHPNGRYPVIIGRKLLPRLRELAAVEGAVVVVTDTNVGRLYADQFDAEIVTVPAGEYYKRLETVAYLYDEFLAAGLDRQGTVVALGGGVIGDMAGFAAATYMRGVRFVQCPTSLLAMVDASVGGKTGVDLPQGKNLIGAFKQPAAVIADLDTLQTLPPEQFAAGIAEVIKGGLIGDKSLFEQLESSEQAIHRHSPAPVLRSIIMAKIRVKQEVVQSDPFESGRRVVLNLGHTFGHAIEQVSDYQISHGYGVAMGLVAAARLSAVLGHCDPTLESRIEHVLVKHQLPVRIPADLSPAAIIQAMSSDKKKTAGQVRFILIKDVGEVFVSQGVGETGVLETIQSLQE